MKKFLTVLFSILILAGGLLATLSLCKAPDSPIEETPTATITATATSTPTIRPPSPTTTPIATATYTPIDPSPTHTPTPTPTMTPRPSVAPTQTVTPMPGCLIRPGDIYIIQPGDTLWDIAGCAYGRPEDWPVIYRFNVQLTDPDLIHAGNPLLIPHRR